MNGRYMIFFFFTADGTTLPSAKIFVNLDGITKYAAFHLMIP